MTWRWGRGQEVTECLRQLLEVMFRFTKDRYKLFKWRKNGRTFRIVAQHVQRHWGEKEPDHLEMQVGSYGRCESSEKGRHVGGTSTLSVWMTGLIAVLSFWTQNWLCYFSTENSSITYIASRINTKFLSMTYKTFANITSLLLYDGHLLTMHPISAQPRVLYLRIHVCGTISLYPSA